MNLNRAFVETSGSEGLKTGLEALLSGILQFKLIIHNFMYVKNHNFGSPGLKEAHVPKAVGSNPGTVCWMEKFHIYLL